MPEDPEKQRLLNSALRQIMAGDRESARESLSILVNQHLNLSAGSADLGYFIFAAALSKRVGEEAMEEINLYLRDYDVAQIRLFNLLATKVPTVSLTGPIANNLLAMFMIGRDEVSLIDVGIGTGRQEVHLLHLLAARKVLPKKLTIVGIEPSLDSLEEAGWVISAAALEVNADVEFRPIQKLAEQFLDEDWEGLKKLPGDILINEAFAVHHIISPDGGPDLRDRVLKRLCELDPLAFVLSEPSSDHHTNDLAQRFANCFHHFTLTFKLIDELDIEERDKNALKVCFFGREIEDILGNGERFRTERHEAATAWLSRLERAGFVRYNGFGSLAAFAHDKIQVAAHDGYVGLDYQDETLVAVMCAIPERRMKHDEKDARSTLRDVHRGFNPRVYLRALAVVAHADGHLHEREREFIEEQARLFGIDMAPLWEQAHDLSFLQGIHASERTKAAILRDAIVLANIDGEYHEQEQKKVREIAALLHMDEQAVLRAEQEAPQSVPPLIVSEKAPLWLKEYWAIGAKGSRGTGGSGA
jgi:tellurite resistance protein